jgi:hypothetical protein
VIRYFLYMPLFILTNLAAKILAPVAVIWFSTDDRKELRSPFVWMMTLDADLGGDKYWPSHITGDRYSTWNRINWMWRNGGHTLAYWFFGCNKGDERFPLFRKFYPVKLGKYNYLELFFGWNHPGAQSGRAKYVLTVRLKEKV